MKWLLLPAAAVVPWWRWLSGWLASRLFGPVRRPAPMKELTR